MASFTSSYPWIRHSQRFCRTREDAKSYYVSLVGGEIVEQELDSEMIE